MAEPESPAQSPAGQNSGGLGELFKHFKGMPSPEKLLFELQRLNTNLENITPALNRLSSLDTETLKNLNQTLTAFYYRVWPPGK